MNIINKFTIEAAFFGGSIAIIIRLSGRRWWFPATERNTWRSPPSNEINFTTFSIKNSRKDVLAATSGVFLIKNYRSLLKRNWLPSRSNAKLKRGWRRFIRHDAHFLHVEELSQQIFIKSAQTARKMLARVSGKSKSIERLINYLSC